VSFGNVQLSKFRIFFGKKWNFQTRKIFAKNFGKKFKNFGKKFKNLSLEKSSDINQKCTSISKISNPVLGSKTLEKVWKKFG